MNKFKIEKGKSYFLNDAGPHINLFERTKTGKLIHIKFVTKKEILELKATAALKEIELIDLRDSYEPNNYKTMEVNDFPND